MFAAWRSGARKRKHDPRRGSGPRRRATFERLEDRALLTAAPYGALPDDTGEFMLGDVLVSVVLMESSTKTSFVNPNSENWTPPGIEAAKQKVVAGMTWWEQTLAAEYPAAAGTLRFQYDFTYADQPVLTDYEPIHNPSSYFQYWIYDFLDQVGHGASRNFSRDIRSFNHAQRVAHGTDWAFTVFVVNDANDADGMFGGGPFLRAFAYAGGQFLVSPAGRPASTFAHEAGHMFWARDEYQGGGSYVDQRGYYNAFNSNAWDNPAPGFVQSPSIMARDELTVSPPRLLLSSAWENHTSSASSLEMIGWRDSDGDGIPDVIGVPHSLSGGGYYDPQAGVYRFQGTSAVQTLPNHNSSGLQSDITINRISRAEYRLDGGSWNTAATYTPAHQISLDLSIPVPAAGGHTIEIRTVDDRTGVTSAVFRGQTGQLAAVPRPGINGFVWFDENQNGEYDPGEQPLPGWTVRLVDAAGQPLQLEQRIEPDLYAEGTRLDNVHAAATLRAFVNGSWRGVAAVNSNLAATGNRVLGYLNATGGAPRATWDKTTSLRIDFSSPVTAIRLDAIGSGTAGHGRLAVYNSRGELLARVTTGPLGAGEVETLVIERGSADIAYAIASQHGETTVLLDNLRFGPPSVAVTDVWGGYSLPGLSPGSYRVQAMAPSSSQLADTILAVVVPAGETPNAIGVVESVNFGAQQLQVSWQNPGDPADVNADGLVSALDALLVINYINSRDGDTSLPAPPAMPGPYYDVNGNGFVSAADVLIVVNRLNQPASQSAGEAEDSWAAAVVRPAEAEAVSGESPAARSTRLSPLAFASATVGHSLSDPAARRMGFNSPASPAGRPARSSAPGSPAAVTDPPRHLRDQPPDVQSVANSDRPISGDRTAGHTGSHCDCDRVLLGILPDLIIEPGSSL